MGHDFLAEGKRESWQKHTMLSKLLLRIRTLPHCSCYWPEQVTWPNLMSVGEESEPLLQEDALSHMAIDRSV